MPVSDILEVHVAWDGTEAPVAESFRSSLLPSALRITDQDPTDISSHLSHARKQQLSRSHT